ncbi:MULTISPECIES: LysR substrate-binding domain-containing protein [unclassified Luteimonas]
MDRFDAMQAFVRVVETGSFTRAADTLQSSRTRVTQLVQQLETHLRVKLLHRTTRKVNVTADGTAYYERVVRLLADLDDAETSLSTASDSPRGRLRVDVPAPLASLVLVPALPAFHARYPDIQLDLGASDRRVDLIDENVDCVVRGGEPTGSSLRVRHVADLPLGVYAAPGYLARAGVPGHPQALEEGSHRIVGYRGSRSGVPLAYAMRRGDEQVQVHGRHVLSVDDGNAYLAAGVAGMGVLWLPRYMARTPQSRGELIALFEDWQLDPMPLYVAFAPSRHVSRKLRVFIDWIVELMAQHAPEIQPPSIPAPAAAPKPPPLAPPAK